MLQTDAVEVSPHLVQSVLRPFSFLLGEEGGGKPQF